MNDGLDKNTKTILAFELQELGYSKDEINRIIEEQEKAYIERKSEVELSVDDLVNHMSQSSNYKKFPKSTLKCLVLQYKKRSHSVSLRNDFLDYLNENAEHVDQELWVKENSFLPYLDNPEIYKFSETEEHHISNYQKKEAAFVPGTQLKQDYRNLISGTVSSLVSRTIVAPLDRLKMLYQVNYLGADKPPSMLDGLKQIYKSEGYKGYFKGNGVNLIKGSPENGIKLYCFELSKWHLQNRYGENLSTQSLFLSGAFSGVIATIVIFPLEVLKLRIAASAPGTYNGIFDALRKIYREPRGLFNFYSGLEASICAVIPNAGLNLTVYEGLKIFYSGRKTVNNAAYLSTPMLVFIGGFSAMISSTVLYPLQIIQSRMIMDNLKGNLNNSVVKGLTSKYKLIRIATHTYHNEGIKGFFKGYAPGITKIVIGNGIGFSVYENTRKLLGVNKR